jgi:hypothetical protein
MAETESVLTQQEEDRIKSLIGSLRNSKGLYDNLKKRVEVSYLIAGKTMKDWEKHFRIEVEQDLLPHQIREIELRLVSLYQEATFLKAAAERQVQLFHGLSKAAYREAVTVLIASYKEAGKRLPAKETIQAIANKDTGDTDDAAIHAELELSFWKSILSSLDTCRKLLETTLMALAVEMKSLGNEKLADSIIAKHQHRNQNDF